jgi:hypothetical protein
MSKFSMSDAQARENKYNTAKLLTGDHVCEIVNVRENTGFHGTFFHLDMKVIEGPSGAGFEFNWRINPDLAKGGAGMPVAKARALDLGKIQAAVAACYGLPANKAAEVSDAVYAASIAQPSPLKGRKVRVSCRLVKGTTDKTYYVIEPFGQPPASAAELAPAPVAPAVPAAVSAPAFPPAGWAVHPQNPAYYYKVGSNETPILEAELRARAA